MPRVRTRITSSLATTFEGKPVNLTTEWMEVSEALAKKLLVDAPLYVEFEEAPSKPAPDPVPSPQPKSRPFGRSKEE